MPNCENANIRQGHTRIETKVCKQTQFNETKTIANEEATKRNSRACSTERNVKAKTKVNKKKHTLPDKIKDRTAQSSTRPYERMETQVREPNVNGYYFSPKNVTG